MNTIINISDAPIQSKTISFLPLNKKTKALEGFDFSPHCQKERTLTNTKKSISTIPQ